jgi:hypothetical protein
MYTYSRVSGSLCGYDSLCGRLSYIKLNGFAKFQSVKMKRDNKNVVRTPQ